MDFFGVDFENQQSKDTLKLIFRGWYRKAVLMGLICYFEMADEKRCKLFCFIK